MKILIAEDDYVSRKFLNRFLSNFGECDVAVDGLEAIEVFKKSLESDSMYDLVCLDILIPEIDGLATLKSIRQLEEENRIPKEKRTKVIMTTALHNEDTIFKSYEFGTDSFAVKPIDTVELVKIMKDIGLDVKSK